MTPRKRKTSTDSDAKVMEPGQEDERHASRYRGAVSRRWPEGRPLCGADRGNKDKDGKPGPHKGYCTHTAGQQTDHYGTGGCWQHLGNSRNHVVAAARKEIERTVADDMSLWTLDGFDPGQVDYTSTLLQLIGYWRYKFNRLSTLLGEAFQAAERLKVEFAAERITLVEPENAGYDDKTEEYIPEPPELAVARSDLERIFSLGGVTAFVGLKYDADRYGRVYPVEEGIRGLEKLVGEASDRLAKYCALAHTAKIAEQRMEWAQKVGVQLASVIEAVVNAMGPSTEQRLAAQAEFERQLQSAGGPLAVGAGVM